VRTQKYAFGAAAVSARGLVLRSQAQGSIFHTNAWVPHTNAVCVGVKYLVGMKPVKQTHTAGSGGKDRPGVGRDRRPTGAQGTRGRRRHCN